MAAVPDSITFPINVEYIGDPVRLLTAVAGVVDVRLVAP